jgi:hypothetical protein
MARDTTPAYVVEVSTPGYRWTPAEWRVRTRGQLPGYGKPTDANLAAFVRRFEESSRPGGVNAHLGATRVASAQVRRNTFGGDTVATYQADPEPLFTVVGGAELCGPPTR